MQKLTNEWSLTLSDVYNIEIETSMSTLWRSRNFYKHDICTESNTSNRTVLVHTLKNLNDVKWLEMMDIKQ